MKCKNRENRRIKQIGMSEGVHSEVVKQWMVKIGE